MGIDDIRFGVVARGVRTQCIHRSLLYFSCSFDQLYHSQCRPPLLHVGTKLRCPATQLLIFTVLSAHTAQRTHGMRKFVKSCGAMIRSSKRTLDLVVQAIMQIITCDTCSRYLSNTLATAPRRRLARHPATALFWLLHATHDVFWTLGVHLVGCAMLSCIIGLTRQRGLGLV